MSEERYPNFFVEWIEQWSQFFEPCNWRTFQFCFIEIEDDRVLGAVEGTFVVLGLGFRARYTYCETDKMKWLKSESEKFIKETEKER